MQILLITHYFPPEIGAPQTRLSELARHWTAAGDEVTVLTAFPNHPTGIIPAAYRKRLRMEERVDGYRILRTWVFATPNKRVFLKTLSHITFMLSSIVLGLRRAGRADVVVVSSPTFFSMLAARFVARVKRAKLVIEVRDLWPAAIAEVGVLRNPRIIRALEALELSSYRAADLVVPTSSGFARDITSRGIDPKKVHVITNGVDLERFAAPTDIEGTRGRLGAEAGECLALYAGTHGMLYNLPMVADAAAELQNEPVHFAFVGEGVGKSALAERVESLGLRNVTLLGGVPAEEIPAVVQAADICLLPLRDTPMVEILIAAKVFEYMAAGRAILASVRGETADILQSAGALVVPPDHAQALAESIAELASDPERRKQMGDCAREYVSKHYDRARLAAAYRAHISEAMTEHP